VHSKFHLCPALVLAGCASAPPPPAAAPAPAPVAHGHHAEHHHHAHRFEDADQWSKVFDDPARDAWQQPDQVIAALGLTPAMHVADVGAGTGYFAVRLAHAVPQGRVIATDIEPSMVEHLTARAKRDNLPNLVAQATPPDDPKLDVGTLDRVLVVDVWHHVADRPAFAKHLARALKPGGAVAVVDFKLDAPRGPPPKFRLAPEAIGAELAAAGLTVDPAPIDLPDQYIVIGRRP